MKLCLRMDQQLNVWPLVKSMPLAARIVSNFKLFFLRNLLTHNYITQDILIKLFNLCQTSVMIWSKQCKLSTVRSTYFHFIGESKNVSCHLLAPKRMHLTIEQTNRLRPKKNKNKTDSNNEEIQCETFLYSTQEHRQQSMPSKPCDTYGQQSIQHPLSRD